MLLRLLSLGLLIAIWYAGSQVAGGRREDSTFPGPENRDGKAGNGNKRGGFDADTDRENCGTTE